MKIREFDENSLIDYYSKNIIDFSWIDKPSQHQFRWRCLDGTWNTSRRRIRDNETFVNRVIRKIFGVAAASSAFAIGCHLTIDVFQPKSVVFPGIGSLLDGTLVDDNVWLFGNAIYCFKVADHLYALALGEDYERVKQFVIEHFINPFSIRKLST